MKLEDIFPDDEDDVFWLDDVSVLLPKEIFDVCVVALESAWQESSRKDWMYRVDPPDPKLPLQRHIHIARSKHIRSKNMQASWNADGTRHDTKSFNDKVANNNFVQKLARDVLKLPDNVCLESHGENEANIASDEVTFSKDRREAYIRFLVRT